MIDRAGVIFIDCWQGIVDSSSWPEFSQDFDFFKSIKAHLEKYQPQNLVFHTGVYGSLPLACELVPWYRQGNAVDIMDIIMFDQHYRAREIFNWIVVGAHWQRCTHEKSLGFFNLLDLKKIDSRLRVFSHQDCTVKFLNDDIDNPVVTTCNESDYQPCNNRGLIWQSHGSLHELVGP